MDMVVAVVVLMIMSVGERDVTILVAVTSATVRSVITGLRITIAGFQSTILLYRWRPL